MTGNSNIIQNVFGSRSEAGPLFSFWTHFPEDDMSAERQAKATINLQRDYDLDLVKTAPNGMYAVEDFGLEIDFSQVPLGGVARIVSTPFQQVSDWGKLAEPDIEKGAFAREISALRMIREALPDVPIVFTIFSPMTIAAKLSQGRIHQQIREDEGTHEIHAALRRLADAMRAYASNAIAAGADGLFFAHQDTGAHLFSLEDFNAYVAPYDIEVLAGAAAARFNVLHIHGEQIRFRELQDYPVHALNWHSWETLPTLAAGAISSGKCVVGGIDRRSVTENDLPAIREQITSSLATVGDRGQLILAPSCTVRAGFDPATITAMRDIVHGLRAAG